MKRLVKTITLISFSALILCSCKSKQPQEIDLSSIHTTAAPTKESAAPETKPPAPETTTAASDKGNSSTKPGVSASLGTYQSGDISIEYPVVSHMDDSELEKTVNEQLKSNAMAVIKGYDVKEDSDTLKVQCKVITADRKGITVTYTGSYNAKGAAHPVNIFYTNTINLNNGADVGLADYGDAESLAAYVQSDDCQFYGVSSDVETAAREYLAKQKASELQSIFEKADFPINGSSFPESFSYEKQGVIYVSVPVPHAVGDYVLVKFTPETK